MHDAKAHTSLNDAEMLASSPVTGEALTGDLSDADLQRLLSEMARELSASPACQAAFYFLSEAAPQETFSPDDILDWETAERLFQPYSPGDAPPPATAPGQPHFYFMPGESAAPQERTTK